MSFRSANILSHMVKFNSAASCDFLDLYNKIVDEEITAERAKPSNQSIAPSSSHCRRVNWFRLRGVQPDISENPDKGLDFTAKVGTALHEVIQSRLKGYAGEEFEWIDVSQYLAEHPRAGVAITCETHGYETRVAIDRPPIRFACDGIVRFKGKLYILEIKSCEFSSLQDLTEPKQHHVDQVRSYSALLGIQDVLVLYIDRQYGDLKCFELHFTDKDNIDVWKEFTEIQQLAEACIAPEKLPPGDPWCSSSMCSYYKKCKEW